MHERGMADDELIEDHEREKFSGVAGSEARDREGAPLSDQDRAESARTEPPPAVENDRATGRREGGETVADDSAARDRESAARDREGRPR